MVGIADARMLLCHVVVIYYGREREREGAYRDKRPIMTPWQSASSFRDRFWLKVATMKISSLYTQMTQTFTDLAARSKKDRNVRTGIRRYTHILL